MYVLLLACISNSIKYIDLGCINNCIQDGPLVQIQVKIDSISSSSKPLISSPLFLKQISFLIISMRHFSPSGIFLNGTIQFTEEISSTVSSPLLILILCKFCNGPYIIGYNIENIMKRSLLSFPDLSYEIYKPFY